MGMICYISKVSRKSARSQHKKFSKW